MTTISRTILKLGVVIASIWTVAGSSALAQQSSSSKPASEPKKESVSISRDSVTVADVQKAADDLAAAVQAAVRQATEDPAVKVAALKVAKNAVTAAQMVIKQQGETLQAVLDALAREIAVATDKQQAKTKSH